MYIGSFFFVVVVVVEQNKLCTSGCVYISHDTHNKTNKKKKVKVI